MRKVFKTTFDAEQEAKDEAFIRLTPLQRLEQACQLREAMRTKGVDYSYKGQKVKVTRLS